MTELTLNPLDPIYSSLDCFGLVPNWSSIFIRGQQFDTVEKPAIVTVNQLNKKTPLESAGNTNQGLTLQAGVSSMVGWARSYQRINQPSIAAIAIDGFLLSGGGSWK